MEPLRSQAPQSSGTLPPRQRLVDLVNLRYLSQAITVANEKQIAHIVTTNVPVHISEIAKKLDCHETNLYRLMSYLAAYGIFEEKEDRLFIGNEMSEAMREDISKNCYNMIQAYGLESWVRSIINLERVLDADSSKTPFEITNGEPLYNYLPRHPEEQQIFDLNVINNTLAWQTNVPSYYDFSRYNSVVDLAGGVGGLLKAVLLKCPNVQGTLFEKAEVLEHILPELSELKLFHTICGNFFEPIDVVADLFMIANTLHCFEDDLLRVVLANIAGALRKNPGSRLLIIEIDYDTCIKPNVPSNGRNVDIRMMAIMGGRERDFKTWQTFLQEQNVKILQKFIFPPNFIGLECELV